MRRGIFFCICAVLMCWEQKPRAVCSFPQQGFSCWQQHEDADQCKSFCLSAPVTLSKTDFPLCLPCIRRLASAAGLPSCRQPVLQKDPSSSAGRHGSAHGGFRRTLGTTKSSPIIQLDDTAHFSWCKIRVAPLPAASVTTHTGVQKNLILPKSSSVGNFADCQGPMHFAWFSYC